MSCDRCDESREEGYRFCPACGAPLDGGCPHCEESRARGDRFCNRCGRPLVAAGTKGPGTTITSLGRMAGVAAMVVLTVVLLVEAYGMIAGFSETWTFLADRSEPVYVILPTLITVGYISGLPLQLLWAFIAIAIVASLILVVYQTLSTVRESKDAADLLERSERTPLFWVTSLLGFTFVTTLIVVGIQIAFGMPFDVPSNMPEGGSPDALYSYANAAVWEEIISRVFLIGIPMLIISLYKKQERPFRTLLGGFGFSKAAVILVIVSSLLFGYAHSGGWGASKILPASIGGFVMGYLYVRFGLHAAILYHFLTDYLIVFISSVGLGASSMVILFVVMLGLVALIHVSTRIISFLKGFRDLPDLVAESGSSGTDGPGTRSRNRSRGTR